MTLLNLQTMCHVEKIELEVVEEILLELVRAGLREVLRVGSLSGQLTPVSLP